ncbi:hypothetical protein RJ639_041126 [Escallonia herrerae]|uniref:Uncharacterized protein n=1 Tax=Escallonia herrerae TaxID=1293975 RepID=A0AA89BCJ2_9ASTE|nr:hypothetical protein RJ639_041126 [Escallonia herrerae]
MECEENSCEDNVLEKGSDPAKIRSYLWRKRARFQMEEEIEGNAGSTHKNSLSLRPICSHIGRAGILEQLHKEPVETSLMPSSVMWACNSNEGIKVMGLRSDFARLGLEVATTGLPVPSCELGRVIQAKAWATWSLETGALREAGFTEQRSPCAHDSGRITSRRTLGPFGLASCFK